MSVFTHAMVEGINARLQDAGLVAWPSEKVASEVCAKVASDLQGPEVLPAGGLSKESALLIMQHLKTASDKLVSSGYAPTEAALESAKLASAQDLSTRAATTAVACMDKAASESGSLTNVGQNTLQSAAKDDQHAKLDLANRPEGEYHVGVGKTQMPSGGKVGKEQATTVAPGNSPSINNSLTAHSKSASQLADLALGKVANEDMEAADLMGSLGGGGGAPPSAGAPPGGAGGQDPLKILAQLPPEVLMQLVQALQSGGAGEAGPPPGAGAPPPGAGGPPPGAEGKMASADDLVALLKRAADGSLTNVDKNTLDSAAKDDQHAALDKKNRPEGKYLKGVGKTEMPEGDNEYDVKKNPAPGHKDVAVSNSLTKKSSEKLSSDEQEYFDAFQKVANAYGPKLPLAMPKEEKVAHLQALMGQLPAAREAYLSKLVSG